jgi:tRNA threonylcarbamoyladenosine biosynthesis protein TsaE
MAQLVVETDSAAATCEVGHALARLLSGPAVVALAGDLGAGKTTFVQGLGKGFGIAKAITSPTFVLINRYRCSDGRYLEHADCYRLTNAPLEMWDAGLADLMWSEDVVVIEWADQVAGLLPDEHLVVEFVYLDDNRRRLTFTGRGAAYSAGVEALAVALSTVNGASAEPLRLVN